MEICNHQKNEGLTLTNMTFAHTAGFAVQTGDIENAVFENIRFESCYADGLHLNGNSENMLIRTISFDDINGDGNSTASGTVGEVICDGVKIL